MAGSEPAGRNQVNPPPSPAGEGWRRIAALRPRLAAVGAVLVAMALLAGFALVLANREAALNAARLAADNLALGVAEQTASAVQAVDVVLLDLQLHATQAGHASAEAVHATMAGPGFASWIRSSVAHVRQIEALLVADAQGRVIDAAGRFPPAALESVVQAAVQHFAAAPNDGLFISAPLPQPTSTPGQQPWIVHLARQVNLPDGTPAGVIVACLRLDAFGSLYTGLRLPADSTVALLRRDGTLLLRQPPLTRDGLRVPPDRPWHAVVARGGGNLRAPSVFDGQDRMLSVRPLQDYPLVSVVGVSETAALAGWWREAVLGGVGALTASACILLLLRALLRQFQQVERSQASLEAANENLSRKSRELETTLATMDQGLMMVDADRTVAVCNQRAVELLDLPPELMASRPGFEQVLAYQWRTDEFHDSAPDVQAFISAGGILDRPQTYERHRPNGQVIEVRSVPLSGGGVVRTYTDITARTLGEERFRQIFNDCPLAIALISPADEHLVQVNPACCVLAGRRADEMEGKYWPDFIHPDDHPMLLAQRQAGVARATTEARLLTGSGKVVWMRVTGSWLPAAPGRPPLRLVIGEDVTLQREMEARLRQAQRLEAVGQLTGGVAHDFNNLLAVIMLNAELLAEAPAADPERARLAAEILATAGSGAELIRRLLAFARRQPLQPRPMDLNASITEAARLLQRTLGATVRVQLELAPDLWRLRADASQVGDALLNLALNARDAMPQGGTLTIATANITTGDARPEAVEATPDLPAGDYVALTVTDTGIGMPPEVLDRAVEPFFTTKPPGAGTGLGLSMIYGFARQSGGMLVLHSAPGSGTRVRLLLPRAEADAEASVPGARPANPPGGRETVLVVDDNPAVRDVAARQLAALGYAVHTADSGPAALEVLRSDTKVNLLFTDIIMSGGMTGIALAGLARRQRPSLKVLFTTGFARIAANGTEPAPSPLLYKPYRRQELAEHIRAALDG